MQTTLEMFFHCQCSCNNRDNIAFRLQNDQGPFSNALTQAWLFIQGIYKACFSFHFLNPGIHLECVCFSGPGSVTQGLDFGPCLGFKGQSKFSYICGIVYCSLFAVVCSWSLVFQCTQWCVCAVVFVFCCYTRPGEFSRMGARHTWSNCTHLISFIK